MALPSPDIALHGARLAWCALALLPLLAAVAAEPPASEGSAAPAGASAAAPDAGGTTQLMSKRGVIKLEMSKTDIDGKSHQMVLHDVVVTQGDLKVKADRADGTGFDKNSHWVFSGNVLITAEARGTVKSERATVEWQDGVMTRAVATGAPAEFEQTGPDTGLLAHGRADSIEYGVTSGKVKLTGNASVTQPGRKLDAEVITYNIREQQVEAAQEGGDGKRVVVTFDPARETGKQEAKRVPKP
jgi:lipopolysaccharide export system protein LptA